MIAQPASVRRTRRAQGHACDSLCRSAHGSPETCTCACRGTNHGATHRSVAERPVMSPEVLARRVEQTFAESAGDEAW